MVYQCEKALTDAGDKIDAAAKSEVEAEIAKVKEALQGTDTEAIKVASEALQQKFYGIAEKLYQQANPNGNPDMGANPGANAGAADDNVYEADYREVNDDNN